MEEKKKNTRQILVVISIFALVVLVGRVTYAFFNYTRTGSTNTIRVGRIAFNTQQGTAVNLTNVFPVDVTNGIPNNDPNVGSVIINVTGDTEYTGGVEYLVSAVNVSNTVGGKQLPISIDISYSANGTGKTVGIEVTGNDNYFTVRGGKTSYYKVLAENTISVNDNLIVGYIAPGATGIDGNIVIRTYIDATKVAISDTYDGTESDNNGTTSNWVNNRTVFTTEEWNSLQANGISFQVKVEAQEGTWVEEEETLYHAVTQNAVMDNVNSTYVQRVKANSENVKPSFLESIQNAKIEKLNNTTGIDFSKASSETNGRGVYIRSGTENNIYPIHYFRGKVENNNVAFAGFCWLIVRTTETGGVKLVYNGELNQDGTCTPNFESAGEASEEASSETANINKRLAGETFISINNENKFCYATSDCKHNSPAYVGYMYGTVYETKSGTKSGTYWSDVEYSNGVYKLKSGGTTSSSLNNSHHYICEDSENCAKVRFYVYLISDTNYEYYIELMGGDTIESAIEKMQVNTTDSNVKEKIDTWYGSNMTSYTNKIEDTIWCNDRSIESFGGYSKTGVMSGLFFDYELLYSHSRISVTYSPSLSCTNKNDRFTVSNENGNKALIYPVGMLTVDELMLSGLYYDTSEDSYMFNRDRTWIFSPGSSGSGGYEGIICYVDGHGRLSFASVMSNYGLRPSISLKHGTIITSGTGTMFDPYVIS